MATDNIETAIENHLMNMLEKDLSHEEIQLLEDKVTVIRKLGTV